MLTYDKALRAVGKAINALRNEARMQGNPLPPTPYVVAEVASRITLDPTGEWYDQNCSYTYNIRRLVDRILKGDGVEYLREVRSTPTSPRGCSLEDVCLDEAEGSSMRQFLGNIRGRERLLRRLNSPKRPPRK